MSSRVKKEMRETVLGIMNSGVETSLNARDLKRLGIDIPVPRITPRQIQQIRKSLRTSQEVFALILGISKSTVSQWERGERVPSGVAAVLLNTIKRDPKVITYRVAK